jgi:hypothetical protein
MDFPKWLDQYPIVDADHIHHLETLAAIKEFHDKVPRHEAEAAAHGEYKKDQQAEAAAFHLTGMKAAHAAGDMDSAKKHGVMYSLSMRALGHDPVGEPPHEVANKMAHETPKIYHFKAHAADAFSMPDKSDHKDEAKDDLTKAEAELVKAWPKLSPNALPVMRRYALPEHTCKFCNQKVKIKEAGDLGHGRGVGFRTEPHKCTEGHSGEHLVGQSTNYNRDGRKSFG